MLELLDTAILTNDSLFRHAFFPCRINLLCYFSQYERKAYWKLEWNVRKF